MKNIDVASFLPKFICTFSICMLCSCLKENPNYKIVIYDFDSLGVKNDAKVMLDAVLSSGFVEPMHVEIKDVYKAARKNAFINIFIEQVNKERLADAQYNLLVVNPEIISRPEEFEGIDAVLCKSHYCSKKLNEFKHAQGLHFKVWYVGFTSLINEMEIKELQKDYNLILHPAGKSIYKETSKVINVWKKNPSFPKIVITCIDAKDDWDCFHKNLWGENSITHLNKFPNIEMHTQYLPSKEMEKLNERAGLVVAPSSVEGFGHYLNEARGYGSVVITTNFPPMNEIIRPEYGFLVGSKERWQKGPLQIPIQDVSETELESAVKEYLRLDSSQKLEMSIAAQEAFQKDRDSFRTNIRLMLERNFHY